MGAPYHHHANRPTTKTRHYHCRFPLAATRAAVELLPDDIFALLEQIDTLPGTTFEAVLLAHYRSQGYRAELTPATHDYGADIVLSSQQQGIIVVQVKRCTRPVSK